MSTYYFSIDINSIEASSEENALALAKKTILEGNYLLEILDVEEDEEVNNSTEENGKELEEDGEVNYDDISKCEDLTGQVVCTDPSVECFILEDESEDDPICVHCWVRGGVGRCEKNRE